MGHWVGERWAAAGAAVCELGWAGAECGELDWAGLVWSGLVWTAVGGLQQHGTMGDQDRPVGVDGRERVDRSC